MRKKISIAFLIAVISTGCYYDVEEQLYPGGPCDTGNVTYLSAVAPILQNYGCISCHSGAMLSGNISLEGYNNVRAAAENGKLYGSITHSAGFSPMPQGGNKMSACDINKIKTWIDAGIPNN